MKIFNRHITDEQAFDIAVKENKIPVLYKSHVKDCQECQHKIDKVLNLESIIRQGLLKQEKEIKAPDKFADEVMTRIKTSQSSIEKAFPEYHTVSKRFSLIPVLGIASVVVTIAFLIGIIFLVKNHNHNTIAQATPNPTEERNETDFYDSLPDELDIVMDWEADEYDSQVFYEEDIYTIDFMTDDIGTELSYNIEMPDDLEVFYYW